MFDIDLNQRVLYNLNVQKTCHWAAAFRSGLINFIAINSYQFFPYPQFIPPCPLHRAKQSPRNIL